ncbi:hypothetical protein BC832DRAFT_270946 [Gaertneriomyces semiglobifer]|nr:hypothetical protein BC832DRAFT_270946 [Gaertneriomyces semiglobifer]
MVFLRLINTWRTLNLPWRSQRFVGHDPNGHMYFEGAPRADGRARRIIQYPTFSQPTYHEYDPTDIPVQWQAWLRYVRSEPPTIEEIQRDEARRLETIRRAQEIEAKEQLRIEAQKAQQQLPTTQPEGQGETFEPGAWTPSSKRQ